MLYGYPISNTSNAKIDPLFISRLVLDLYTTDYIYIYTLLGIIMAGEN